MRSTSCSLLAAALVANVSTLAAQAPASSQAMYSEPAISPDRSEIAFASGGDIWTVPASGGEARLLVSHPATESRPLYSPDGTKLAFVSTRTGSGDIYVLTLATGDLRRLTWDDQPDQLDAWSADGRWLYFTTGAHDIGGNDIYRIWADGGTPMPVSADRYANEYWAAPSPDGRSAAFTARGTVSGQWWRHGHSHLDESEIWVLTDPARMRYRQVTAGGAKDAWPMWGADGSTLFFVSDRDGAENIWAQQPGGQAREVTHFQSGRVLWPNASYDGRVIVFERDFRIWLLDPASGEAHEVPITLRGTAAGPAVEHLRFSDQIQDLALSPDGLKVAFVVHGEVFSASAKDGGDAARVTNTAGRELEVQWTPDSRQLVYVSDRDGFPQLFLYDFATRTETALTRDTTGDLNARLSPDGKQLAFMRGGRDLCVVDVASRLVRTLASGHFDRLPFTSDGDIAWSPDGRFLAYANATGGAMFRGLFVVPAAGGPSRQVSFLANVFGGSISWSGDGKFLLFETVQRTEPGQLARIDLVPRTPRFREDQFTDLFKPPTHVTTPAPAQPPRDSTAARGAVPSDTAAPPHRTVPVEITFEGIRERLSLVPVGLDVGGQVISPDGKTALLWANAAGQTNLYTYSLDELAREPAVARQLTSTAGTKSYAQFSPDGKEVWYLEAGRINIVTVESRQTRQLAVTAEMDVDFAREKRVMFDEAYRYLRDVYADSAMNGADWPAVRTRLAPYAAGARTPDEMRRLIGLMIGELNSSHMGVSAPAAAAQPYSGRLGLDFDREEYERSGRLKVSGVIPLGPAALSGVGVGDYLAAVNGSRLEGRTNLDSVLAYSIGRRTTLTLSRRADRGESRDVAVRPVNTNTERQLRYRQWVEAKRAYVERVSGGRLGYVHMPDMGAGSLQQLFVDLDVENRGRDGVVIDIRHNNGGFVNAYAIDVFARRGYMTMTYRGAAPSPARTILGQRALERPTILVTDQHSLSDAEDFTEGYRSLHLGSVVGEPTAGWIIYTSGTALIDGSILRLPFIQIRGSDGQVMEMHPRPVDIRVDRPIGESYTDHDSQLDAAVTELLRQIGTRH